MERIDKLVEALRANRKRSYTALVEALRAADAGTIARLLADETDMRPGTVVIQLPFQLRP
jgi:hypothetical protein